MDWRLERPVQRVAAAGEVDAFAGGVEVGAAAAGAPRQVELNLAARAADQAQQTALARLLAAGNAGPDRVTALLWQRRPPQPPA